MSSNLYNSAASFSWASSLFGAGQAARLLNPGATTKLLTDFYSVTNSLEAQFNASPVFFGLQQIGAVVQQSAVDLFFDTLSLKPLNPAWLARKVGQAAKDSFDAAVALTPGTNLSDTFHQTVNAFDVINLVNQADATLDLPPGPFDLLAAVDRAYARGGDYASVWIVEGLGKQYALHNWPPKGPDPRDLMTNQTAKALPDKSLQMLHAGIGIAFGQQIISALTPYSAEREVESGLRRFLDLVQANARPNYHGPAYESLGLVTRTWYPQMAPLVDRQMTRLNPEALEYFWHGVGRALFFNPRYMIPGSNAFEGAAQEAPHQLAALNAIAGAAWAYALVNIKQPSVIANLVKSHAAEFAANPAFTSGVASTVMMATATIPNNPWTLGLSQYRPQTNDSAWLGSWDRLVHIPCQKALSRWLPALQANGRLGEIFRYQDLERWDAIERGAR